MKIEDFVLDKNSKVKLYRQLYNFIANAIESQAIKNNFKLPSVREMAFSLDASKNTITKAYSLLESSGYIYSVPKSGYFTKSPDQVIPESKTERQESDEIPTVDSIFKEREGSAFDNSILNQEQAKTIITTDAFSNLPVRESVSLDTPKKDLPVILPTGEIVEKNKFNEKIESFESDLSASFNKILYKYNPTGKTTFDPFGEENFRISFSAFLYDYESIDVNPNNLIVGSSYQHMLRDILTIISLKYSLKWQEANSGKGLLKVAETVSKQGITKPTVLMLDNIPDYIKNIFRKCNIDICEVHPSEIHVDENFNTSHAHCNLMFIMSSAIQGLSEESVETWKKDLLSWVESSEENFLIELNDSSTSYDAESSKSPVKASDRLNKVIYIKSLSPLLAKGFDACCMTLPTYYEKEFKEYFQDFSCSLPLIAQLVLSDFMISGKMLSYLKSLQTL